MHTPYSVHTHAHTHIHPTSPTPTTPAQFNDWYICMYAAAIVTNQKTYIPETCTLKVAHQTLVVSSQGYARSAGA